MSRFESYASDHPLQYFSFAREQEEGESERDAALELVAATATLMGDWISPLTVDVRVESCNSSNYYFEDSDHPPTQAAWFLRRHELDKRLSIGQIWTDSQERRVDTIGAAEMLALVKEALTQPPPLEHLEVALSVLAVRATEVALPQGVELSLKYGGGPLEAVLAFDGERWLALGPDHGPVGAPARLRAYNEHGSSSFELELCWDFWREHPAGRAQARAAIERVLARGRGWKLEQGALPLP